VINSEPAESPVTFTIEQVLPVVTKMLQDITEISRHNVFQDIMVDQMVFWFDFFGCVIILEGVCTFDDNL